MDQEKPYKKFLCDYHHDGHSWAVTIDAKDWEDAEARVCKLGNLRLRGEVVLVVPTSMPSAHWLVKAIVRVRNWLRGM